jgi:hypothetical protein
MKHFQAPTLKGRRRRRAPGRVVNYMLWKAYLSTVLCDCGGLSPGWSKPVSSTAKIYGFRSAGSGSGSFLISPLRRSQP